MAGELPDVVGLVREVESLRERVRELESESSDFMRTLAETEARLREREDDFRVLMETIPEMVSRHHPDSTYVYVSPGCTRLFGYLPEDLVGRKAYDFIHPEDVSTVKAAAQHALETGEIETCRYRHLKAEGTYVWVETIGRVITVGRWKEPKNIVCVIRDITARKQEEEALRESEERYRLLFEYAGVGIGYYTSEGVVIAFNKVAAQHMGGDPGDFVGKSLQDLFGGIAGAVFQSRVRKVAQNGQTQTHEDAVSLPVGDMYFRSLYAAIKDPRGKIVSVQIVASDITDHKVAEHALRESEERYRAVVEDQTEVICRFLADGTITFVNDVYTRFFGGQAADLIGKKWQLMAVSEDLPRVEAQLRTLSATNPVILIENRVYSGGGQMHWMQFVNRGFFDARGHLTEMQSVGRDVTEQKRANEALAAYQKQLQSLASDLAQSEERERRRIAVYLHDQVGQLLVAVRVKFATWKGMKSQPKRRALLSDIEQLIDQTIEETRTLTFELSPPILYELGLEPALEWLGESLCEKESIAFKFVSDGRSRRIEEVMASTLYRIMRELLLNALTHAQAKHISVSVSDGDSGIRLEVADDGIGMSHSRYEQALKGIGGTYGLFSIRERLRDMNGSLEIVSSPGEGTRATVALSYSVA